MSRRAYHKYQSGIGRPANDANTVANAYAELTTEGWLLGRAGASACSWPSSASTCPTRNARAASMPLSATLSAM